MFQKAPSWFLYARNLTLFVAALLIGASAYYSRTSVFMLFNFDGGSKLDVFFKWATWGAEGWIWIPYFIVLFSWFKKDARFILLNFLLSTLLTQIPKNLIWGNLSRPITSGIPTAELHTVKGVIMHSMNSFPSGHTATAFTLFLLTTYLFPSKTVFFIGLIYAFICAYSRVYLGQHFPMDLGGGMIVGVATVVISIGIIEKINQKLDAKSI
jgi:membrane-associated phospholipid phosphatase